MGWDGPLTHRQFLAWRAWLATQWDRPSRSDHYLMQISAETIRPHLKKGVKVKLADFRLAFGEPGERKPTPPQSVADNKATWLAMARGLPGARYVPGPAGGTG